MAASIELVIMEFVILAIACLFLLRHYAASMVSFDVLATVYTSWVLGFSVVLLLPYDLSIAIVENTQSPLLASVWAFAYWSTFFLAWLVLPVQMEYHSSGHFSFNEKIRDALHRLLFQGIIAMIAGICYLIYMVSTSGGSLTEVIGFTMAMGNTYGMLLITLLMGNGLIAIPVSLWRLGNVSGLQYELYLSAIPVEDSYQTARYELEDCEAEVTKVANIMKMYERGGDNMPYLKDEIGRYVHILQDKTENFQFSERSRSRANANRRGGTSNQQLQPTSTEIETVTSKTYLISLHARLMNAQIKARASERRWKVLITECRRQQELASLRELQLSGCDPDERTPPPHILVSMQPNQSSIGSSSSNNTNSSPVNMLNNIYNYCSGQHCCEYNNPYYNYYSTTGSYLCLTQQQQLQLFSYLCRSCSILSGLFSAVILWSELLMSSGLDSPIGSLLMACAGTTTANNNDSSSAVMVQAISFLALVYMSLCTYWPLFRLNIGWAYKLQGPQQSSPSSLLFNAEYLSRLQFALGYNFLMFLNVSKAKNAEFNQLMHNMELIPVFGTSFSIYLPLIMLIVALLTFFDGYGRVIKVLGIELEDEQLSSSNSSSSGFTCFGVNNNNNTNDPSQLTPEIAERLRVGKQIVSNEIKQRKAAEQLALLNSTATTLDGRSSHANPGTSKSTRPFNITGSAVDVEGDSSNNNTTMLESLIASSSSLSSTATVSKKPPIGSYSNSNNYNSDSIHKSSRYYYDGNSPALTADLDTCTSYSGDGEEAEEEEEVIVNSSGTNSSNSNIFGITNNSRTTSYLSNNINSSNNIYVGNMIRANNGSNSNGTSIVPTYSPLNNNISAAATVGSNYFPNTGTNRSNINTSNYGYNNNSYNLNNPNSNRVNPFMVGSITNYSPTTGAVTLTATAGGMNHNYNQPTDSARWMSRTIDDDDDDNRGRYSNV